MPENLRLRGRCRPFSLSTGKSFVLEIELYAKFEVLTEVLLNIQVFWEGTPVECYLRTFRKILMPYSSDWDVLTTKISAYQPKWRNAPENSTPSFNSILSLVAFSGPFPFWVVGGGGGDSWPIT